MAIAKKMLCHCAGDAEVGHTPGADLTDHLDRPLAVTRALGTVMPRRVALKLLRVTELLLAGLTKVHELFQ